MTIESEIIFLTIIFIITIVGFSIPLKIIIQIPLQLKKILKMIKF